MKFLFSSKELHQTVVILNKSVDPKSKNLAYGKIHLQDTLLTITTCRNFEQTFQWKGFVHGEGEGEALIDTLLLQKILAMLPEQPITLELNAETGSLTLTHAYGKLRLVQDKWSAELFARTAEMSPELVEFKLQAADWLNIFEKLEFCSSVDELRPGMCGIHFELEDGKITAAATDAHVLGWMEIMEGQPEASASMLVKNQHVKVLKGLFKRLPGDTDVATYVCKTTQCYCIEAGAYVFRAPLEYARFPEWRTVLPEQVNTTIKANRLDLLKMTGRINIGHRQTIFRAKDSVLEAFGEMPRFDGIQINETMSIELTGKDVVFGMSHHIFQPVLKCLDTEEAVIEIERVNRGFLMRGSNVNYLAMPVMITSEVMSNYLKILTV